MTFIRKTYFDQGNYSLADNAFSIATSLDSSFNQQVSDMYFDLGNSTDEIRCVDYYRIARKYSGAHNQEIGQRLVALAKADKIPAKEKNVYKKESATYLSKAEMEKEFPPDYVYLDTKRTNIIDIYDGKPSPKYYRLPRPGHSFFVSFNKENSHFYLLTRSGEKIIPQEISKGNFYFPEQDFKVVPTKKKELSIMISVDK